MSNFLTGIIQASTPAQATCGVVSGQLVAYNEQRKGLILTNLGTTISLSFGTDAAVLNKGITLTAGAVFTMDEFNFTTWAINGIGYVSGDVAIQEFIT